jgi:hypothetical protein
VDNAAVVRDSGWKRFWLGSLNLVLALLVLPLLWAALVQTLRPPQVNPAGHPGVRTYVWGPGEPPIVNCGGSALRVAVLGPKVVATTPGHARTARIACWWAAYLSAGSGVIALLLVPLSLFGAATLKTRIERGGRLAPSQPNGQEPAIGEGSVAAQHSAPPAVAEPDPPLTWRGRVANISKFSQALGVVIGGLALSVLGEGGDDVLDKRLWGALLVGSVLTATGLITLLDPGRDHKSAPLWGALGLLGVVAVLLLWPWLTTP